MAWPFTTPVAPSFDTGLMAVPETLTSLTTETKYLVGIAFANPTGAPIFVTVTNTAGDQIVPTTEVTDALDLSRYFPYRPCLGLKWQASAAGLKGQMWGW